MNKNNLIKVIVFTLSYIPFYVLITNQKTIVKVGAFIGILIILLIGYLPLKDEKK